MGKRILHHAAGLVEVSYRPDLAAVYLKWFSEYGEGTRVKDAVLAALDWVRAHDVAHWVADVSTSPRALSERDYRWVSGEEFRAAILDSPLRKFVLIPPLPNSGQDAGWVADWEQNTLTRFGDRVQAKVCDSIEDARAFLAG
ncbi:hypothetical protein [Tabrizicola oligotrophica]|uniref:Uncharacterized protein n=1 Tax=Tabrizicola oligotrophica TaxID=2710650 RepID=A0A6M0QT17_9RHOB|nr:hypothetical protein [Tabrizicola oligotrophica]NEY90586.1 hypothetical protein [Tabrizicola oligotrophica]